MRKLLYCLVLVFVLGGACEKKYDDFEFDCDNCYREKPGYGPLVIYFSVNAENDSIPYTIYKGNFEDRIVEYSGEAVFSEEQIDVPVDEYYSVEALYVYKGDTIHVVDGDKLRLKKERSECDEKCYYFEDGVIDVRLKL